MQKIFRIGMALVACYGVGIPCALARGVTYASSPAVGTYTSSGNSVIKAKVDGLNNANRQVQFRIAATSGRRLSGGVMELRADSRTGTVLQETAYGAANSATSDWYSFPPSFDIGSRTYLITIKNQTNIYSGPITITADRNWTTLPPNGNASGTSILQGYQHFYKFTKESGWDYTITLTSSQGDADLYTHWVSTVRRGTCPNNPTSESPCHKSSALTGPDAVVLQNASAGDYFIAVYGFSAADYSIQVTGLPPLNPASDIRILNHPQFKADVQPVYPGTPVDANFYLKNNSGRTITLDQVVCAIVKEDAAGNPGPTVQDLPMEGSLTLTPGQEIHYQMSNLVPLSAQPGRHRAIARFRYSGTWYDAKLPDGTSNRNRFVVRSLPGTLQGQVTSSTSGVVVKGASVTVGQAGSTTTDAGGNYTLAGLLPGIYATQASAAGYSNSSSTNVTITSGQTTTQNFTVTPNFETLGVNASATNGSVVAGTYRYYQFTKAAGWIYTVTLYPTTTNVNPDLFGHWSNVVSREAGQYHHHSINGPGSDDQFTFTANEDGSYYLAIYGITDASYTLRVAGLNPSTGITIKEHPQFRSDVEPLYPGSDVDANFWLKNNSAAIMTFSKVVCAINTPQGGFVQDLVMNGHLILGAGEGFHYQMSQRVPLVAPPGSYAAIAKFSYLVNGEERWVTPRLPNNVDFNRKNFAVLAPSLQAPTLDQPGANAELVAGPIQFRWNISSHPYPVTTEFAIRDITGFSDGVSVQEPGLPPATVSRDDGSHATMVTLAGGRRYRWTARSWATYADAYDASAAPRFVEALVPLPIPGIPTLLSPPSNSIDQPLTPTFRWSSAADATSYRIQLSPTPSFQSILRETERTATSYVLPSGLLSYQQTYYWRVRSENTQQVSNWSPPWQFTTFRDCAEPSTLYLRRHRVGYEYEQEIVSNNASPPEVTIQGAPTGVVPEGTKVPLTVAGSDADGDSPFYFWKREGRCEFSRDRCDTNRDYTQVTVIVYGGADTDCVVTAYAGDGRGKVGSASVSFQQDNDGDGIVNDSDAYPNDPNEWIDSDGDGIGDNADPDDDNDGVADGLDQCAETAPGEVVSSQGCSCAQFLLTSQDCPTDRCNGENWEDFPDDGADTCTNGVVTAHSCTILASIYSADCDPDDDNDGVPDEADACPNDPNDPVGDPCNHRDGILAELSGEVTTPFGPAPGTGETRGTVDGIGNEARFTDPFGMAMHPSEAILYVADHLGNKIRQIDLTTNRVTTLAGPGPGITAGGSNDGVGEAARFASPIGLAIDSRGENLYVVDEYTHKIRKIVVATREVSTLAGPVNCRLSCPFGDAGGVGNEARFSTPEGIAIDPTDTYLVVADAVNNKIRKVEIATRQVTTLAGPPPGDTGLGDDDGVGTAARFFSPVGMAFHRDANGTSLYVADGLNNKIRRIDTQTREVTTPFGPLAGTNAPGDRDAARNEAQFWAPIGLVIDPSGTYLYVAERDNRKVRKIVLATGEVTTLAGPTQGLTQPGGLVISPDGTTLYISDANQNKIRKLR